MVGGWSPGIKRRRVPGPSVRTLLICTVVAVALFFALTLIFVIGMAVRGTGYQGSPFLTVVILLMGVFGISAGVCNVSVAYWVGPAEARAGYTTKRGDHQNLSQVDPRTNRVLRMAGEPFLDPDEYRRRLALIREAAVRESGELGRRGAVSTPGSVLENDLTAVIKDAAGTPLTDGDTVVIIRDLKFNDSASVIKAGTEVHGIRLAYDRVDDRVVGVRVNGMGWLHLRPSSVRKV